MPHAHFPLPASADDLARLTPADWQAVTTGEPAAAAHWMLKAAQLGHADAQTILGQWLLDGHGVTRAPSEALAWFLKAAIQGQAMGMNMAGRCFENGWGTEADTFVAANWYRQAAGKGLDAGMYNFANLLVTGQGVKQDHAEALQWYRKAAALGHAKSMTKIGHFYEDGRVVAQDTAAAFTWFEGGARGGDFRGQFNYAGSWPLPHRPAPESGAQTGRGEPKPRPSNRPAAPAARSGRCIRFDSPVRAFAASCC